MPNDRPYTHNNYYIELFHELNASLSSGAAAGARQARARDFIKTLRGWVDDQLLTDEVSALRVTALGSVMLTCTPDLVERLEELDMPDVIAITTPVALPAVVGLSRAVG